MAKVKVKAHKRKNGVKVKGYTRYNGEKVSRKEMKKGTRRYEKALKKLSYGVKTSSSDPHKPGLWPNYWMKKRREEKRRH